MSCMKHAFSCSGKCYNKNLILLPICQQLFKWLHTGPNFIQLLLKMNKQGLKKPFENLCHRSRCVIFIQLAFRNKDFHLEDAIEFFKTYLDQEERVISSAQQFQYDNQIIEFILSYLKQKVQIFSTAKLIKKFLLKDDVRQTNKFDKLRSLQIIQTLQIFSLFHQRQRNQCLNLTSTLTTHQLIQNVASQISSQLYRILQKITMPLTLKQLQMAPLQIFYKSFLYYSQLNKLSCNQKTLELYYKFCSKFDETVVGACTQLNIDFQLVNQNIREYIRLLGVPQYLGYLILVKPEIQIEIKYFYHQIYKKLSQRFLSLQNKANSINLKSYEKQSSQIMKSINQFLDHKIYRKPQHILQQNDKQLYGKLANQIRNQMEDKIHRYKINKANMIQQQKSGQNIKLDVNDLKKLLLVTKQYMVSKFVSEYDSYEIFKNLFLMYHRNIGKEFQANHILEINKQYQQLYDKTILQLQNNYNIKIDNRKKAELFKNWSVFCYLKYISQGYSLFRYAIVFYKNNLVQVFKLVLQEIQDQKIKNIFKQNCEIILQAVNQVVEGSVCFQNIFGSNSNQLQLARRIVSKINQQICKIKSYHLLKYKISKISKFMTKMQNKIMLEDP